MPSQRHTRIIAALERQRQRTGRVRAIININPATARADAHLLLRYTHRLQARLNPRARILVVDTYAIRARRRYNGRLPLDPDHLTLRSGSRPYSTRGFGTFHHATAFDIHRYGRKPAAATDVILNLASSVPMTARTSIILIGRYSPRSSHPFSVYCRTMAARHNAPFIIIDAADPPPLRMRPTPFAYTLRMPPPTSISRQLHPPAILKAPRICA